MMKNPTTFSFVWQHRRVLCCAIAILCFCQIVSAGDTTTKDQPARPLGEIDIIRIQELYNITDTFEDQIWPGFDTRKFPVAINNDNIEELLIGHPNPPEEYYPFEDFELNGQPVLIRDGISRYGPKGGGWAVEFGGVYMAYVSTLMEGQTTERYLSLLLHECFHCFQKGYRQGADGAGGELPEDDPNYSAMIGLESRILKAALDEPNDEKVWELIGMFAAVRHERRKDMPENLVLMEGENEYSEGTATYSQARMYQLMAENGGITPVNPGKDPYYQGFFDADEEYLRMISMVIPPTNWPITFFHSMYRHGMAQCLLLDRVRPEWKEQMREKGMTQFALLEFALIEKGFLLLEDEEKELLTQAKTQFDYDSLLSEQTEVINERLDLIRGYIDGPGRRYRIHHNRIETGFMWMPFGPVYHIPESLEKELLEKRREQGHTEETLQNRRTVWVGGIRHFEKEGLLFESTDTPVIFGREFLEWIESVERRNYMKIECESQDAETYVGVRIETTGFTLEIDKARIEWVGDVVNIYPITD
jgi:hypothetical protein